MSKAQEINQLKKQWQAFGHTFKDRAEHRIGAAVGGGIGAAVGAAKKPTDDGSGHKSSRLGRAFIGGTLGAAAGHGIGQQIRVTRLRKLPAPEWLSGAKTKHEAKKIYRARAMQHHPDRGGNPDMMKRTNTEWEAFEKSTHFDKLAHLMSSILHPDLR